MDQQPHLFSNIPFLALPIMAVIIVVIGVAIATNDLGDNPPLPTEAAPTPTSVVVVPKNCMVIQEEPLFIVMQCQKSTNFHY